MSIEIIYFPKDLKCPQCGKVSQLMVGGPFDGFLKAGCVHTLEMAVQMWKAAEIIALELGVPPEDAVQTKEIPR